jgi:AraC family transcriptional regulator
MTTLEDLLPTLAELAANRDERRSLADLAADAGTSASTFQRAFSRLVGESPKQYTRRLQLESAALALIATDRSVLDIALDVGFDSHEGFTRVFASHFGIPPREFRQRHAHLAADPTHAALIHHLGPCIGLFRAPLQRTNQDHTMNYDITRQPIEASAFLYRQARCSHADIAKTLAKLLGGVVPAAMKQGIELRSPPTTHYLEWGPGMVTIRAGVMIAPVELPAGLDVELETLPACEAAVTIHTGPYDGLADAHAAVEQFLAEHDLHKAGAPREVYLTDPGEVPDPKQWKTQIVWPVR